MYNSTNALGHDTIYIRLRDFGTGLCPFCDSEVEELYPDSGHTFLSLDGWKNAITYWYRCTNPECPSGGKYKAPQPYILPYKKFGLDVWVFVCQEWERFKTTTSEISQRLAYKGVYISEDTVASILEDYLLLKDTHLNESTFKVVKQQGFTIVGCDGTPTESGNDMLWTFYDVISGRLLYVDYLHHADWKTLLLIFKEIRKKYQVPITCFLSDHQGSIVKACEEYDSDIPHQTCHYHFLRNLWVFIEEKDRHMNKELRKIVNSLSIGRSEQNGGTYYSKGIKVEKQDFFQPLYHHLKKIVNSKTDEFVEPQGMKAYKGLSKVVEDFNHELISLDKELRPVKQLIADKSRIHEGLCSVESVFSDLKLLNEVFQRVRKVLGDDSLDRTKKRDALEDIFTGLFDQWGHKAHLDQRETIKSESAQFDMENNVILCQWTRLWDSHKANLFFYYDVPGLEKTNIYNEQLFSFLKSQCVKAHGRAHKNYMVLTRGDLYLTDICHKDSVNIHEILTRYDLKELTVLREPLQAKKDDIRAYYRNSDIINDSVSLIAKKIRDKTWEDGI